MGTPEFMSPEQALGKRDDIDARSDQFALAVLAHTLLARRSAVQGRDTPLARRCRRSFMASPEPLVPYVPWAAEGSAGGAAPGDGPHAREPLSRRCWSSPRRWSRRCQFAGALMEPARACPSASVSTSPSRSDPELAQVLAARRTPGSGAHRAADAAVMEAATLPWLRARRPGPTGCGSAVRGRDACGCPCSRCSSPAARAPRVARHPATHVSARRDAGRRPDPGRWLEPGRAAHWSRAAAHASRARRAAVLTCT